MSTSTPQASWFQPDSEMTEEQLSAAVEEKLKFPQVVKKKKDPLITTKCECGRGFVQNLAALSFMILPEPKNGIYAFVKVRGCWENQDKLKEHATMIIKDVDSKFGINGVAMGTWVPVTDDSRYEEKEILIREDLRNGEITEDPIRKAEEKHQQIIKQLREREKALSDPDAADDPTSDKDSIEYYSMRRVTVKSIGEYIAEGEEKLKELRNKRNEIIDEIKELNKKHEEYPTKWIDVYNKKRKEVGMRELTLKEFKDLPFADLN